MSKTVVLAEKPSVGRDLARVLKCHKKGNGYLEGDQYIVTWALGHLVTLADPEGYGKEFQSWRLEDLPIIPEPLKLVVIKKPESSSMQSNPSLPVKTSIRLSSRLTQAGKVSLLRAGSLRKRMSENQSSGCGFHL